MVVALLKTDRSAPPQLYDVKRWGNSLAYIIIGKAFICTINRPKPWAREANWNSKGEGVCDNLKHRTFFRWGGGREHLGMGLGMRHVHGPGDETCT